MKAFSAASLAALAIIATSFMQTEATATFSAKAKLNTIVEVFGGSAAAVDDRLAQLCPNERSPIAAPPVRYLRGLQSAQLPAPVVKRIVDSGDPSNRIDVVFMGDGYTASEQAQFFADIQRLTNEMFTGDTFAQYLPLFNIWAAFVPSVQSGIGVDGTELRGIYATNPGTARTICNGIGKDVCDFPALIGNDDYYGGLGGEFVITTKSTTSGTIALRHELGHNFGSTGAYNRWYIKISVSGADTSDALAITLDGKPLSWKSNGQKDRTFYTWMEAKSGFSAGAHVLQVRATGAKAVTEGSASPIITQLCNAAIY
ncbi:hypothetical protein PybrP1_001087, partial [[Pythium] brassicae (nom. inval.)]